MSVEPMTTARSEPGTCNWMLSDGTTINDLVQIEQRRAQRDLRAFTPEPTSTSHQRIGLGP
jgi:hypothetical protein